MADQEPENRDAVAPDAAAGGPGDLTVVYVAASATDANVLVSLLAEAGIRAMVANTVLDGAAGVESCGWPATARVAVPRQDAQAARAIAMEFDRAAVKRASIASQQAPPEESLPADTLAGWPRCPECGERRTTRCPVCATEGTVFRQADPDYSQTLGVADDATPLSTCSCGGSCHKEETPGQATQDHEGAAAGETDSAGDAGPPSGQRLVLLCPTCDEPFMPQFAQRCDDCGHEFADGYAVPRPVDGAYHFDFRLAALVAAVLIVVGVLILHFASLLAGR